MQLETSLPRFEYHNNSIDISIDVSLDIYLGPGEKIYLDVKANGRRKRRIETNLTQAALNEISQDLRECLYQVVRNNHDQASPTSEEVQQLAEKGHLAFKRILVDSGAWDFLSGVFRPGDQATIAIESESLFLPWELIYPASLDKPLSYENFWGMRHHIYRVITASGRRPCLPRTIEVDNCPKLGLLTYRELVGVKTGEIIFLHQLSQEGRISLFCLRSLNPDEREQEFNEFRCFWNNRLQLVHFACHACNVTPRTRSYIRLSQNFDITLSDIELYIQELQDRPLIIMNACDTGNSNPLSIDTFSFVDTFLRCGARGVVATECEVPDAFAADFAQEFYQRFLSGKPLGESVLESRLHFLKRYNNPSGLLYSLYAYPSTQLVQVENTNG
ncbi:CHAT domain-containing protein [Trichothermofontia sp.]